MAAKHLLKGHFVTEPETTLAGACITKRKLALTCKASDIERALTMLGQQSELLADPDRIVSVNVEFDDNAPVQYAGETTFVN
jgi:hypothetical protein